MPDHAADEPLSPAPATAPSDEVRVVVVDDNFDAADMMAAALELEGYQSRVATSGEQALPLIEQFCPHVVLLDVNMPGIDGNETTRRLRASGGQNASTPTPSGNVFSVAQKSSKKPASRYLSDILQTDYSRIALFWQEKSSRF